MKTIHITTQEQIKAVLWLIKALSKNERRPDICCIHSDGYTAVATDGRRMHIWKAQPALPAGNWALVSKSKNLIVLSASNTTYPTWKQVVPVNHSETVTIATISEWTRAGIVLLKTSTFLDIEHVIDALGFGTLRPKGKSIEGVKVTFNKLQQGQPLGLEPICIYPEQDKQIVLMPLRIAR